MNKQLSNQHQKQFRLFNWMTLIATSYLTSISVIAPAFSQQSIPVQLDIQSQPNPYKLEGKITGNYVDFKQITNQTNTATGTCAGWVHKQPDYILTLNSSFKELKVEVTSNKDTTLIVEGPGGTWCNDDFQGNKNPAIPGQWLKGSYKIWVGYNGSNSPQSTSQTTSAHTIKFTWQPIPLP